MRAGLPLLVVLGLAIPLLSVPPPTPPPAQPPGKGKDAGKDKEPGKDKQPGKEEEPDTSADDLRVLKDGGLKPDGPVLIEYFRERTFKEADPKQVDKLIRELGDEDFIVREQAYADLLKLGTSALAAIRLASEHAKDPEAKRRAVELRQRIESRQEPIVQVAVARTLGRLKTAGAAETILAFLPFAADAHVTDQLCKVLAGLTVIDGKVDPVIVQGLKERHPIKRGAAGEAIARAKV